ncbi:hypothetical protein [Bacillus atrophaeus]|nr:hypothetical protein [Bacillus atrophaeus]MEC0757950.1 hypothetical protein [Bacillus atrophaeus]
MLKLTDRQYRSFVRLLEIGDGDKDTVISEIIQFHGTWGVISNKSNNDYAPLDSIDRYSLVEAVVTGRFEKIRSPLKEVERLISVYERRTDVISHEENPLYDAFNDFVTELEYLKEIILNQEGAE